MTYDECVGPNKIKQTHTGFSKCLSPPQGGVEFGGGRAEVFFWDISTRASFQGSLLREMFSLFIWGGRGGGVPLELVSFPMEMPELFENVRTAASLELGVAFGCGGALRWRREEEEEVTHPPTHRAPSAQNRVSRPKIRVSCPEEPRLAAAREASDGPGGEIAGREKVRSQWDLAGLIPQKPPRSPRPNPAIPAARLDLWGGDEGERGLILPPPPVFCHRRLISRLLL